MPRRRRIELAGAIHHVTAKSPSGRLLFRDDEDRKRYLGLLDEAVPDMGWSLRTYCQMTNHVHLLVQTPTENLGDGMKLIHENFATFINRKYGESGHVFGYRFKNKLVLSERHYLGCLRYIARNPVEARICDVPGAWGWSAHSALAGTEEAPEFLDVEAALLMIHDDAPAARAIYRGLVASSGEQLLAELRHENPESWVVAAVDDFGVSIGELAAFLDVSTATAYRRVAKCREKKGPGPSFSRATQGPGPFFSGGGGTKRTVPLV